MSKKISKSGSGNWKEVSMESLWLSHVSLTNGIKNKKTVKSY